MKRIVSYDLEYGANVIDVPVGAQTLSVGLNDGVLSVWVFIDTACFLEKRKLIVVATGHTLGDDVLPGQFIGRIDVADGVLHVFDQHRR